MPIYVAGTHDAMPPGRNWPKRKPGRSFSRRHKVEVRFGEPITPAPGEHRSDVMERVRAFMEQQAGADAGRGRESHRPASASG